MQIKTKKTINGKMHTMIYFYLPQKLKKSKGKVEIKSFLSGTRFKKNLKKIQENTINLGIEPTTLFRKNFRQINQ